MWMCAWWCVWAVLSKKDRKKYAGQAKTVASKKVAQPKGAPRLQKQKKKVLAA
jgi:hypothetical protein